MGIHAQKVEPHWSYLLAIEHDLEVLSRFVEFDERNFGAFGIEIARLLLACGAETDVVCKQACIKLNAASKAATITAYRKALVAAYPTIPSFEVTIPRFGLSLHPWDEWRRPNGVPFWWTAYNKTKHQRHSEYQRANLKNALNAVAGLFVMVLYLYRDKATFGQLVPRPLMLRVSDAQFGGTTVGLNHEVGENYLLP